MGMNYVGKEAAMASPKPARIGNGTANPQGYS